MPEDELLTIAEAARRRGVSHAVISRLVKAGRLPHVTGEKNGRVCRLLRAADVDAFQPEPQGWKPGRPRKPQDSG